MNQQATTAGTTQQAPTQDFYGQTPQEETKPATTQQQTISSYDVSISEKTKTEINDNMFSSVDFGPLKQFLDDDNITDISYSNNGQVWLKSLDKGVYRIDNPGINNDLMEKIAFQCANIMGKTFNMASPTLDSESAELRMNFVHDSIARNGIAAVFRKTPAKIRLQKEKLLNDKYITENIHDFLIKCVQGHCNIMVSGETGSGKTELIKYLASHTAENEKIITIEDTLELHLDKIYPHRDIVSMKTNNIAGYSDVLVTCMRQNPKWILLSEVRSAEAVTAVRNAISSGHNVLSTIHADKAQSIPHRMYSLLESNIDVDQFMTTIYRYIQIGIHVRARYDRDRGFLRELCEVCEFHVTEDNVPEYNVIYHKAVDGTETFKEPSKYLKEYLMNQGVDIDAENKIETTKPVETKVEETQTVEAPIVETPVAETQNIVTPTEVPTEPKQETAPPIQQMVLPQEPPQVPQVDQSAPTPVVETPTITPEVNNEPEIIKTEVIPVNDINSLLDQDLQSVEVPSSQPQQTPAQTSNPAPVLENNKSIFSDDGVDVSVFDQIINNMVGSKKIDLNNLDNGFGVNIDGLDNGQYAKKENDPRLQYQNTNMNTMTGPTSNTGGYVNPNIPDPTNFYQQQPVQQQTIPPIGQGNSPMGLQFNNQPVNNQQGVQNTGVVDLYANIYQTNPNLRVNNNDVI